MILFLSLLTALSVLSLSQSSLRRRRRSGRRPTVAPPSSPAKPHPKPKLLISKPTIFSCSFQIQAPNFKKLTQTNRSEAKMASATRLFCSVTSSSFFLSFFRFCCVCVWWCTGLDRWFWCYCWSCDVVRVVTVCVWISFGLFVDTDDVGCWWLWLLMIFCVWKFAAAMLIFSPSFTDFFCFCYISKN
jgi:hypothetical protein